MEGELDYCREGSLTRLSVERRSLPEVPWVSLAEALTWIAFGDAMAPQDLRAQVEGRCQPITASPEERLKKFFAGYDEDTFEIPGLEYFDDRRAGLAKLTQAWLQLRTGVYRGAIKVQGLYSSKYLFADACMECPSELTGPLLATFSQFDVSTGGIRRQPEGSPDVLWRDDPHSFDRELESFGDDMRAADGYLKVKVERDGVMHRWPHPVKVPRKSHEEVVAWCKAWIASGRGNGMDKAWPSFSEMPEHDGLSRDDVFRPAWNEAKAG